MYKLVENIISRIPSLNSALSADSKPAKHITVKRPKRDWYLGELIVFYLDEDSIQYCFAKRGITNTKLVDFGKIYLPSEASAFDNPHEYFLEEISILLQRNNFRFPRFYLCLSSQHTALRTLRFPYMSGGELRSAVYFEGSKKIPFSLNEAYWNHRITETLSSGGAKEINVTLLALPEAHVDEKLELFRKLGIEFDFIFQDVEALGMALRRLEGFDENKPFGLLNIRRGFTGISLYHGSRLKFVHRGGIGSAALGEAPFASAAIADALPKIMENFAEGLVYEIQNSLDFYGTQVGFGEISVFYIHGDLAYSDELIDMLTTRFGITFKRFPADIFSTFPIADPGLIETAPMALSSLAVATSNCVLTDLTPKETIARRSLAHFKRLATCAAVLTALTLGWLWHTSLLQIKRVRYERDSAQEQVTRFELSPAYAGYRILKQDLARQQSIIERLRKGDTHRYLALKEVSALTPAKMRISYFEYYPPKYPDNSLLVGLINTSALAPEISVAEYISRLNDSPMFKDVTLTTYNKQIKAGIRRVTFTLSMRAES